MDSSPPGSPVPGILQARTLEWVAISFSNAWKWKMKVNLFSHVWLLATPWTAAYQAPPSMGFSRQEYWSGVPSPSPMKELGLVILTCSFLSSVELTEKDFKVLIVLERNMRKHKAFCSCAQKIIYKVTIAICSRIFTKNIPGWAHWPQLEAMGRIVFWDLFMREIFMAKEVCWV